jgi:hypothetical protein
MFEQLVLASPLLRTVLDRWEEIALPDGWLVAGAIAQTVWNEAHGFAPAHGIKDVDIVYFDGAELGEEAEASHEARINGAFAESRVHFDVKNEARVHLWYERKFGYPIAAYRSAEQAIGTFPTTATAIGIRPAATGYEICAPFGTDDLMSLIVRPNKAQITADIYGAKVARWRQLWPRLTTIEWGDA